MNASSQEMEEWYAEDDLRTADWQPIFLERGLEISKADINFYFEGTDGPE